MTGPALVLPLMAGRSYVTRGGRVAIVRSANGTTADGLILRDFQAPIATCWKTATGENYKWRSRDLVALRSSDPICEECNVKMERYEESPDTGRGGFACPNCGWSEDDQ